MEHKSDDTFPFSGVKKLQILFLLAVNDFNTWGVFVGSSKEFTLWQKHHNSYGQMELCEEENVSA